MCQPEGEVTVGITDVYIERGLRIAELEAELAELKRQQEADAQHIVRLFEEAGTNSVRRCQGTVYLQRKIYLKYGDHKAACAALHRAGLGEHVALRITDERAVAKKIDERPELKKVISQFIEIGERFSVCVKKRG